MTPDAPYGASPGRRGATDHLRDMRQDLMVTVQADEAATTPAGGGAAN